MAADFGFLPSNEDGAYFISYNSEDSDRVGAIARELNALGLLMWYDCGLEYGAEWERQIAAHIKSCKAVIMFITKKIFDKEKSYVRKEYEMAVDYYDKKVYVVMLDSIDKRSIPEQFLGWWIDLTHMHCITNPTAQEIMRAVGFTSQAAVSSNSSNTAGMSASELIIKGNDYYYGRNGVNQDYTEAFRYYRLAAEQGDARAQNWLGYCYHYGKGVTQDYTEAFRYYRLAAEQGLKEAQNNLGYCYQYGQGVKQDCSEAFRYYSLAAEQGLAGAQNNLGYCYEEGKGVEKNLDEAIRLYKLAAKGGSENAPKALNRLGVE